VLFDENQTTLIQFPNGKSGNCVIPSTTSNILGSAFQNCANLTSVTVPQSVNSIAANTFAYCGNLTNVVMIGGVTSIGDFAFDHCTSLSGVTVGTNLTSIGSYSFRFCTSLTSITIPSGVTDVGGYAFFKCGLTNITIPDTVAEIDAYAFTACANLTAIAVDAHNMFYSSTNGVLFDKNETLLIQFPSGKAGHFAIPDGVTAIGVNAFNGSSLLTDVSIPAGVTNIGSGAFAYCTSLTNAASLGSITSISDSTFFYCTSLTSITLPNSVTAIGAWAFAESNLKSITIPATVTNIGAYAFYRCLNLTEVYFQSDAPSIGSFAFDGDTNAKVYYLPGTTGWGSNFGGIPAVLWNPEPESISVHSNQFGFTITGTTNIPIVVETSANLANASWIPLQTCTLTNGSIYFSDPAWTNYLARFYRIRSP
jgi:hypothetical protein